LAQQQPLYRLVRLYETNGSILCRYFDAVGATAAILWLGGVGGGFDSPAHDLFDRMAASQFKAGVSSLRLRYRLASDLDSCVADALLALEFLGQRGIARVVTIGHSLGGAVAIQAGAASPLVGGVVALATQSYGTNAANRISPRPLLLVHGGEDAVLPVECSRLVFERALDPKELVILLEAGHCFDEAEPELRQLLTNWLDTCLAMPRVFV
jgi:dienelactone hydrolase